MKKFPVLVFLALQAAGLYAQNAVSYKVPPKEMADMLLAKPIPAVSADSKGEWILLSERNSYPSVEELARPELRIAGLRINPANFSLSRQNIHKQLLHSKILRLVRVTLCWVCHHPCTQATSAGNPSENKIAFTQTGAKSYGPVRD